MGVPPFGRLLRTLLKHPVDKRTARADFWRSDYENEKDDREANPQLSALLCDDTELCAGI